MTAHDLSDVLSSVADSSVVIWDEGEGKYLEITGLTVSKDKLLVYLQVEDPNEK